MTIDLQTGNLIKVREYQQTEIVKDEGKLIEVDCDEKTEVENC
jgi:hypothetical protein